MRQQLEKRKNSRSRHVAQSRKVKGQRDSSWEHTAHHHRCSCGHRCWHDPDHAAVFQTVRRALVVAGRSRLPRRALGDRIRRRKVAVRQRDEIRPFDIRFAESRSQRGSHSSDRTGNNAARESVAIARSTFEPAGSQEAEIGGAIAQMPLPGRPDRRDRREHDAEGDWGPNRKPHQSPLIGHMFWFLIWLGGVAAGMQIFAEVLMRL